MKAPEVCPVCDEDVPPNAKACPECGADERSGWNEDALYYDGLDLPDEAWDEPASSRGSSPDAMPLHWQIACFLCLLGMVWYMLRTVF